MTINEVHLQLPPAPQMPQNLAGIFVLNSCVIAAAWVEESVTEPNHSTPPPIDLPMTALTSSSSSNFEPVGG